jgi:hypothetical protein
MASLFSYAPFNTINKQIVPDFFINVLKIIQPYKSDSRFIVNYEIQDSETAEDIADKLYDNVDYDVLIYAINDMINPTTDWPYSYESLLDYCRRKYEDINEVIQYRSIETDKIVSEIWPIYDRYPLTAFEYEVKINDEKRKIKLLTPEAATSVYRQCKSLLKG